MGKISRDTPLAEITLRRYEKPTMNDRDLVRKLCLSIGLLQPGDSRDVVVDVLQVLLHAKQRREELHSEEVKNLVMDHRKQKQLPMLGVASSNIRRQLKRLKDLHLIETNANLYRISEWNNMTEIFEEKIHNFLLQSVISRVKDYVEKIDQEFSVVKEEESVNGQKNLFETPVKED
ncbi:hypothetical protein HOD05_00445 [Candidatus Woesearchaeota archaeon]|jgi:DNA-binding transcriptional ArsR family regulator|nr:hypothetical protein [Candidatus Woesearchaeota archaeon]MBT4150877.1 hypothetical protein [Candidatus Woesearchaeota archaeon]MBT4246890.1 hypothetical protein [Candidatus Woesearchaeota archaeon]MBT4433667.1 hypothetical protein [Candidatus Woesearchaeota archaeon]